MRPDASVCGHALDAVDSALVLEPRIGAGALDERGDRFQTADPGVVAVDDLDLPAPALGIALVHAEKLRGKERRLLAARSGADLEKDVARVIGVLGQEENLEVLIDAGEALGQLRPFRRRDGVELVAGRQLLGHFPGPGQLSFQALALFDLRDDRLELREGLLGVAHGAMVGDESPDPRDDL